MSVSYGGSSITFEDGSIVSSGSAGFKNKIINGAMMIDQRNAGASVSITSANQYTLDRWQAYDTQASKFSIQQNAGSVTPTAGFTNYLGATSSSAYSILATDVFGIAQYIEGYNVSDLAWGTASAATVTLSFKVYSSLTGTFGGSLQNNAGNRTYPFSYTISSANTWTTVSITISGDTTGTWLTTNGTGIRLLFGLGVGSTYSGTAGAWTSSTVYSVTGATSVVGTSGATFYITGVQLEKSTTASSFDFRSITAETQLCQRYFYKHLTEEWGFQIVSLGNTYTRTRFDFKVTMRATPTMADISYNSGGSVAAQFTTVDSTNLFANPSLGGSGTFAANWTASSEL